jgi:hypothetical protein
VLTIQTSLQEQFGWHSSGVMLFSTREPGDGAAEYSIDNARFEKHSPTKKITPKAMAITCVRRRVQISNMDRKTIRQSKCV